MMETPRPVDAHIIGLLVQLDRPADGAASILLHNFQCSLLLLLQLIGSRQQSLQAHSQYETVPWLCRVQARPVFP